MKSYKERQHNLNDRLSKQLRTLRTDYVFSKNRVANKIEKAMANRLAARLRVKEEARQRKMLESDMTSTRSSKERVIDLLKNSMHLPKGQVVKDVLAFGCDPKRIDASISLPRRTLECYY